MDEAQALLEANNDDGAIVGAVVGVDVVEVEVDAADPETRDGLEGRVWAQLGQGVEGEGVVAEDAGLIDGGQQEDLLDSWGGRMAGARVWGGEARGDDGRGLGFGVAGVGGEEDKVEDLGGRGANVEVAVWVGRSVSGRGVSEWVRVDG